MEEREITQADKKVPCCLFCDRRMIFSRVMHPSQGKTTAFAANSLNSIQTQEQSFAFVASEPSANE